MVTPLLYAYVHWTLDPSPTGSHDMPMEEVDADTE